MNINTQQTNIRVAQAFEADCISHLVNAAYRGTDGWTTEANIVSGERIHPTGVKDLVESHDSSILVAYQGSSLVGCVHVAKEGDRTYIGLLAIAPSHQTVGLGKRLLAAAEKFAIEQHLSKTTAMVVVSQRKELISFYERRGYKREGPVQAYPSHANVGVPREAGLTIETLVKHLSSHCTELPPQPDCSQ